MISEKELTGVIPRVSSSPATSNMERRLPGESTIDMVKRVPGIDLSLIDEIAAKVDRSRRRMGGLFH